MEGVAVDRFAAPRKPSPPLLFGRGVGLWAVSRGPHPGFLLSCAFGGAVVSISPLYLFFPTSRIKPFCGSLNI